MGKKGGLAILWYKGVTLELINFSNYHIHTRVNFGFASNDYLLTGFYGILETSKRADSWHPLGRIN